MNISKKTLSAVLAVLLLLSIFPLSAYAAPLKINTQPENAYASFGDVASVSLTATGSNLTYTWYVKDPGDSKYYKSSVSSSTYRTKITSTTNGRYAYCIVKDKSGKTVKSKTVVLRGKATITAEPENLYVKQGDTAKVSLTANGNGLEYKWFIKSEGDEKYSKSSVTKSFYSTTMNDDSNGRYVYCVVTDQYGNKDQSKTVVMRQAVTITAQPENVYAEKGAPVEVTVKAVGDGLTYQWYVKNQGGKRYSLSGSTEPTYVTEMTDKANGRRLYCVVTDQYGNTAKSTTVIFKKLVPLAIRTQPTDTEVNPDEWTTFSVAAANGVPSYTYRWQVNSSILGRWRDIDEFDSPWAYAYDTDTLNVLTNNNDFGNDVRYRCVITDAAGTKIITNEARPLRKGLNITTQPEKAYGSSYDEIPFTVEETGGQKPYTYQWQMMDNFDKTWSDIDDFDDGYEGCQTDELTVYVSDHMFGRGLRYHCVITDANGDTVTSDSVWIVKG